MAGRARGPEGALNERIGIVDVAGIEGVCLPGFDRVRRAFAAAFDDGELGASCAVIHRGAPAVDLWGGHRDLAASRPWERDTIVDVWSITKLLVALCVLILHDRGALSVDEPMADHWPEFAEAGKEQVLIRHVLGHTAGLPGFDPAIDVDVLFDWDRACANLAAQRPWWEPGDGSGYHSTTQGHLLGELVRRVTGRSVGQFLREEIAGPLDADVHLGLPPSAAERVAEMDARGLGPSRPATPMAARCEAAEPDHAPLVNTDRWRRAELPSSNGHGNACSIARVLSCVAQGGRVEGVDLVGPETIERVFDVQAHGVDRILGVETKFGLGFGLHCDGMPVGIHDRTAFGAGWGGSMAVVDVEHEVTVVYVMNRMLPDAEGGLRAARVVFSAHEAAEAVRS